MSKLEKLKEKLAKQKDRSQQNIEYKERAKDISRYTKTLNKRIGRTDLPDRNVKQVETKNASDEKVRKIFSDIKEDKINPTVLSKIISFYVFQNIDFNSEDFKEKKEDLEEEDPEEKEKKKEEKKKKFEEKKEELEKKWQNDEVDKELYMIQYFAKKYELEKPANIYNFLQNVAMLDKELRDSFITEYLDQDKPFTVFYKRWISRSDIVDYVGSDIPVGTDINSFVERTLFERIKEYFIEKNKEIPEDATTYIQIASTLSDKKKNKVYKKIAQDFIALATYLGIEEPEKYISLAKLGAKKRYLISKLGKEEYKALFSSLTDVKVNKMIKKIDKDALDYPMDIKLLFILKDQADKSGKSSSSDVNKIIEKLQSYDIEIPEEYLDNPQEHHIELIGLLDSEEDKKIQRIQKVGYDRSHPDYVKSITELNELQVKRFPDNKRARYEQSFLSNKAQKLNNILFEITQLGYPDEAENLKGSSVDKAFSFLEKVKMVKKLLSMDESKFSSLDYDAFLGELKLIKFLNTSAPSKVKSLIKQLKKENEQTFDNQKYTLETLSLLKDVYESLSINDLKEILKERGYKVPKVLPTDTSVSSKCKELYNNYGWLPKGSVKSVLISPIEKKNNFFNYVTDKKKYIKSGTKKFYIANERFKTLFCSNKKLQQKGDVLTFKNISFMVGYLIKLKKKDVKFYTESDITIESDLNNHSDLEINNKFYILIQNENIFSEQLRYILSLEEYTKLHNNIILNSKSDRKSADIASLVLQGILSTIAPHIKDYSSPNEPYIVQAIKSVESKDDTIRDFFGKIADVTTYATYKYANIFHQRIRKEYYIPTILMHLSPEEKLPEVFNDITDNEEKTRISMYLLKEKERQVNHMVSIYDPTNRRKHGFIEQPSIKVNPKFTCQNFIDVKDVRNDLIVSYTEKGQTYCFDITVLMDSFSRGNFINPITGKKFKSKFIDRYIIKYSLQGDNGEEDIYDIHFYSTYKKFKRGEFEIHDAEEKFDKVFIEAILSNDPANYVKCSRYRGRDFLRILPFYNYCKNTNDIVGVPSEDIVSYVDENGDHYCFDVKKLQPFFEDGKTDFYKNPYTDQPFPKSFIDVVKRLDVNFAKNQMETRKDKKEEKDSGYSSKESQPDLPVQRIDDVEQPKKKLKERDIIIPGLWDVLSKSVRKLEKKLSKLDDDSVDSTEDAKMGMTSGNSDNETKDETGGDDTRDETDETDESSETTGEETRDDSGGDSGGDSKGDSNNEDSKGESKGESSVPNNTCSKCKGQLGDNAVKSVGYDTKPHNYQFCCTKCMENFRFPKFSKR